jgi:cytochrome c oxidase assembly factor CtaG
MNPATVPLTWSTALTSWRWDSAAAVVVVAAAVAYGWAWRRADATKRRYIWWFGIGLALTVVATMSMVGVYAGVLFWVRALQVLLLLYIAPFFLAMGRPVTVIGHAFGPRIPMDRWLASRSSRLLLHPATTSLAMLATPWLLYLTPWYTAALQHYSVACVTNGLLVAVGFAYFYARLQADPVPHRYSQLLSLVISIAESLGDGVLGIVLWLGPLIAAGYYMHIDRQWGPSMRVDQSIGAGVLWLVGDVLGVGFIAVLMHQFSSDERSTAKIVDAALDQSESEDSAGSSGLWWENDPQLRDRMRRR